MQGNKFFNEARACLINCLVLAVKERAPDESDEQTLRNALKLLKILTRQGDSLLGGLDRFFQFFEGENPDSKAVKMYDRFLCNGKRICESVILSTLSSTDSIERMQDLSGDI